jgi:hypothetical protein
LVLRICLGFGNEDLEFACILSCTHISMSS